MSQAKYTKGKLALDVVMALLSLIVLVPLLVVFFGAFKTSTEAIRFNMMPPLEWHPENFSTVFVKAKLGLAFLEQHADLRRGRRCDDHPVRAVRLHHRAPQ